MNVSFSRSHHLQVTLIIRNHLFPAIMQAYATVKMTDYVVQHARGTLTMSGKSSLSFDQCSSLCRYLFPPPLSLYLGGKRCHLVTDNKPLTIHARNADSSLSRLPTTSAVKSRSQHRRGETSVPMAGTT